jgi:hypothetical protein
LLAAVLFCLLQPIHDPDLFWHLATGRWIWEHRQLPTEDPFCYTTSLKALEEFLRARIILTQYWLANIIQYGLYKLGGYYGIIVLRLIIVSLTLLISFMHLRKRGLSTITSTIILLPLSYMLVDFQGDRPNQMTFLFLAIFLYLIEDLKRASSEQRTACIKDDVHTLNAKRYTLCAIRYALLPLTMLLWANIHGGFILGAAISGIYILSESLRVIVNKTGLLRYARNGSPNKRLIIISIITILAGLLNPNGYTVIYSLIKETSVIYKATITETVSPVTFIQLFGVYKYIYMVIIFLVPAIMSILLRVITRSKPPYGNTFPAALLSMSEEIFLVIFFGALSFTAVRYIPLLAIAVTPIIGLMFSGKPDSIVKRLSRFMIPEIAVVGILFWFVYSSYPLTLLNKPLLYDYLPEDTVQFIKGNISSGRGSPLLTKRLLNYYGWGGYLIWSFYPDKVVFIDGRGISQKAYLAYLAVIGADKESMMGKPFYKAILDAYSVRYIMIPAMGIEGGLTPIIPILVNDPEWRLIFYSKNCLLFTRERFEPDYAKVLSYGIAMGNSLTYIKFNPDIPYAYITVAQSNVGLGRRGDAITFLKDALRRRPSLRGGPVEKTLDLILEGKDILPK